MKDNNPATESSFKSLLLLSATHTRRSKKISDITRDKLLYANLVTRIEDSAEPQIKSSLPYQLFRAYQIQASLLPNTYPVKEGAKQGVLNAIDSIKDQIYIDGRMNDVFLDIIQSGFRTEGITFVEYGYSEDTEFIPIRTLQFANVYTDYDKDSLALDSADSNDRRAKWVATKAGFTKTEFDEMYPEWAGKVIAGDPTIPTPSGATSQTVKNTTKDQDKIWVVTMYDIRSIKNPTKVMIAGGEAIEIGKWEGKKYPYWQKHSNGKEYARMPVVDFHAVREGEGICTQSQMGVLADLARVDQELSTSALPVIKRAVSKVLAVFSDNTVGGGGGGNVKDQLDVAWKLNSYGRPSMITLDSAASIQDISADPSIIPVYEQARNLILKIASTRFGINFLVNEAESMKSTIFIGQTKAQVQAVNAIYKINREKFNSIANGIVSLAARTWKADSRKLAVKLDDETGEVQSVPMSILLIMARDWDGYFETDTDILTPLSTAEKNNAISAFTAEMNQFLYNLPWKNLEEIMININALVARARLSQVEDLFKKSDIIKAAQKIMEGRAGDQKRDQYDIEAKPTEKQSAGRDIARELSPNTIMAESR